MRRLFFTLLVAILGGAASLSGAAPLGFDDARHLLSRAAFAATPAEIESFAKLTRAQAVERLLAGAAKPRVTAPPAWVVEPVVPAKQLRSMSPEERKAFQRTAAARGLELRGWWLQEMVATPSPLAEKMTLFWHNHFVSSQRKVRQPQYLYRQNLLLREHALGNFGAFLHAIARDPAMVIYLDNASNRKGKPNENFARELMELFTVGEGNYGERDIKEAARAFTGWSVNGENGDFQFRRGAHDEGMKTVLGQSGTFNGEAVLDILLAQPPTAEFIVSKLWREFVSPQADAAEVQRLAGLFRNSHYDIRALLRALLTADAFYAPQYRATLVKSPVDLVVGTLRQFQFATGDVAPFALVLAQLGQNLFAPPNVKGWPGGEAWINSSTLLARKQFLDRLFRSEAVQSAPMMAAGNMQAKAAPNPAAEMRQRLQRALAAIHFDSERWLQQSGGDATQAQRLVLAAAPQHALPPGSSGIEMVRRLAQDPVYQLK